MSIEKMQREVFMRIHELEPINDFQATNISKTKILMNFGYFQNLNFLKWACQNMEK